MKSLCLIVSLADTVIVGDKVFKLALYMRMIEFEAGEGELSGEERQKVR